MKHWGFILLSGIVSCFLLCPRAIHAQQVISTAFVRADSAKAKSDTLASTAPKIGAVPLEQKSGNTALLLSAILPGAGQIYAHRYYTIPLYWGLGTFFVAEWITCNHFYHNAQNDYADSLASKTVNPVIFPIMQSTRDHWQDTRDKYAIYIFLTYVVNLLDAYVGATLYGFDVSDNLQGTTTVQLKVPFH